MQRIKVSLYYQDRISTRVLEKYSELRIFFKEFIEDKIIGYRKNPKLNISYQYEDYVFICDDFNNNNSPHKLILSDVDFYEIIISNSTDSDSMISLDIQIMEKDMYSGNNFEYSTILIN